MGDLYVHDPGMRKRHNFNFRSIYFYVLVKVSQLTKDRADLPFDIYALPFMKNIKFKSKGD